MSESVTALSFIRTKLHRPSTSPDFVPRPRLTQHLEQNRNLPFFLISAAAGYGKSALIAHWLELIEWPSGWISLDSDDSDVRRFLLYFVEAVQRMFPESCRQTRAMIDAPDMPGIPSLVSVLSNELDAIDQPFILVLDDYHRIDTHSPVHQVLKGLLAHPPIPLHLAMITRRDPPLPLSRLRAVMQMTEVRMPDLRFDISESQKLLEMTVGITASTQAMENVDRELEGWVTGLRLMALALRHMEDAEAFLRRFQGSTQLIREYLISEVVDRQPGKLRDCLLRSALLDRFCAPLCELLCADVGQVESAPQNGADFLHDLLASNLFVIPLDYHGEWYRFHHLFQELLQHELSKRLEQDEIAELHLRASQWFEQNGFIDEAIRHILDAGDTHEAANLVARHRVDELDHDNWYIVERWIELLPPIEAQRPNLLLAEAWTAYERFQLWRLPALLEKVEATLDDDPASEAMKGELRVLQGAMLFWQGETETALPCFEEARLCLPERERLFRGLLELLVGLCLSMRGQSSKAVQALQTRAHEAKDPQGIYFSRLSAGLVFIHILSGNLALARAEAHSMGTVASGGQIHYTDVWSVYMKACTHLHTYELEEACRHFEIVTDQRYILHRRAAIDGVAGLALTLSLLHRDEEAQQAVHLLQSFVKEMGDPAYLEIAQSCQARLQVLQGEHIPAARWARAVMKPPEFAELFMWQEVPALTRARVWIATGTEESLTRADQLLQDTDRRCSGLHLINQTIETRALRSLALNKLGHPEEGSVLLEETLALAAPGRWLRPFLEQGQPMADLIQALEHQKGRTEFSTQLLEGFHNLKAHTPRTSRVMPYRDNSLRETLTNRERDILELLVQRFSNKEIADRLFVSSETVKYHLKNLYQKLDVHNRREAAAVAEEIIKAGG